MIIYAIYLLVGLVFATVMYHTIKEGLSNATGLMSSELLELYENKPTLCHIIVFLYLLIAWPFVFIKSITNGQ